MIKFGLVVILFLSLMLQKLHGETSQIEHNLFAVSNSENELSFSANDNNNYLFGILPSTQVIFNIVPETLVSFSFNCKLKGLIKLKIHSKSKNKSNLSFQQDSFYNRYCSVLVKIFLKTACFRL
jgi:hypothetical protein